MTDNTNIWLNGIMGVVVGDLIYISPACGEYRHRSGRSDGIQYFQEMVAAAKHTPSSSFIFHKGTSELITNTSGSRYRMRSMS